MTKKRDLIRQNEGGNGGEFYAAQNQWYEERNHKPKGMQATIDRKRHRGHR